TTYITMDIAPIPLLWVIPLTLYLLSFILAFSRLPRLVHQIMVLLLPVATVVLILPAFVLADFTVTQVVGIHLAVFFVAAMVCHGELARSRPDAEFLTEFYLWISVGGVLGGAFNALVAPAVFD